MTSLLTAALVFSFAVSFMATRLLCSDHCTGLILDQPNARSLHSVPTPRTGGIGIMIGSCAAWICLSGMALPSIALLTGALAVLFLIEDAVGVRLVVRFVGQCVAAALFLVSIGPLPWPLLAALAVGCVWSANCYNFMDGSDGLAGGMTVIGFRAYALAAAGSGHADIASLAGVVSAASVAFLIWNVQPARIFMGDTGSIPLGFLAAALGIVGWNDGAWPFWFPVLVFSVFVVDATVTLLGRFAHGEAVLRAHRDHHYQRLVRMGWSHRRLARLAYVLMLATAGSALLLRQAHPVAIFSLLTAWTFAFAGISMAINARWRDWQGNAADPEAPEADASLLA